MLWAVWGSLLFLFVVVVGGSVHVFREARSFWRTLRAFSGFLGRAADAISARADEVARKAEASGDATARFAAAVERLSRSVAYARAVGDAGGGVLVAYAALRAFVPRK